MKSFYLRFVATLVLLALASVDVMSQCAMCKAVAQSGSSDGQNVSGGINNAIIYLMFLPYILLFIFFRKKIWGFLKEMRALWR